MSIREVRVSIKGREYRVAIDRLTHSRDLSLDGQPLGGWEMGIYKGTATEQAEQFLADTGRKP